MTVRLHQLESVLKDLVFRVNADTMDELTWMLCRALLEVQALFIRVRVNILIVRHSQIVAYLVCFHRKSWSASEVIIVWEEQSHETQTIEIDDDVVTEIILENFGLRFIVRSLRLIEVPKTLQEIAQLVKDEYHEQRSLLSFEERAQQAVLLRSDLVKDQYIGAGQDEEQDEVGTAERLRRRLIVSVEWQAAIFRLLCWNYHECGSENESQCRKCE